MTLQEIINLIMNNGIGVVCVAYMIYFQNTTMKEMVKSLNEIKKDTNTRLTRIEAKIDLTGKGGK